jgi:ATP-binding cassette subfamily B protein
MGSPFLLGPLDMQLSEGGRLGLFGPIGCGKSTIMHLVTRLYDPPAGTVFWQGKDVLSLHPHALRKEIAYALQTVHLFSDTIRANLTFGLPEDTPLERLEEACARAQILDEIRGFPQGWSTPIGEKGLRLSGGQKQRLALARLFLRDARLYLLDDVLSAVDHATERKLVDELERPGRALIIASHRGSALRRCDEILVLDKGKVVDRGRFDELLRRHPALGRDV